MVKAVFFDIDGTLVGFSTHRLSEVDEASLRELQARGIKIILATGRHRKSVDNFFFPVDGIISGNGSLSFLSKDGLPHPVQDYDAFEIVGDNPFPDDLSQQMAEIIEREDLGTLLFTRENNVINKYNDYIRESFKALNFPELDIVPVKDAVKSPIYEFTVFVTPEEETKYFSAQLDRMHPARWCDEFTDFNMNGVSKALGMDQVLEHLGIDLSETMSFGDGGNDTPMLEHAAIGVAMGNANAAVQSSADYVTCHVDDNGVTAALKHFGVID